MSGQLRASWAQEDEFTYTPRQQPAFPATNATLSQYHGTRQAVRAEQNKRQHDDDIASEQTKKQKTAHDDLSLHNRREDMLTFMGETLKAQQGIITTLNKELTQIGTLHRTELMEVEARHDKTLGIARDEITSLKRSVSQRDTSIAEKDRQLSEAKTVLDVLERQLEEMTASHTTLEQRLRGATASRAPVEKNREAAKRPIAAIVRKRDAPVVDDATLYSWKAVESASDQCSVLYGFTAPQLEELYGLLPAPPDERHKRGPRSKYDRRHELLLLLHYLVHYPTMRVLHEKFDMSNTVVGTTIQCMLGEPTETLFEASIEDVARPVASYIHGVYFLPVQVPQDVCLADRLWCEAQHGHGVWIHAMHDATTEKAVSYCVAEAPEMEAEWFTDFEHWARNGDVTQRYEARMRAKFALTESRYRGALDECDTMVRALLALTNMSMQFERRTVEM